MYQNLETSKFHNCNMILLPMSITLYICSGEHNSNCNWFQTPGGKWEPFFTGTYCNFIFPYFFYVFSSVMTLLAQVGDSNRGRSGWFSPTSQEEGPVLQIPEFLQRKGRSGFPRVWTHLGSLFFFSWVFPLVLVVWYDAGLVSRSLR